MQPRFVRKCSAFAWGSTPTGAQRLLKWGKQGLQGVPSLPRSLGDLTLEPKVHKKRVLGLWWGAPS